MEKHHLVRSLVLTIWVLTFIPVLLSDVASQFRKPFVAYIGGFTESADPVYPRFKAALQQRHPAVLQQLDLRYIAVPIGDPQKVQTLIASSVSEGARLLVTPTTSATQFAMASVSKGTPLVFASRIDPRAAGLIMPQQLQPRAITGVSQADDLHAKRIELLLLAYPKIKSLGILADGAWGRQYGGIAVMEAAHFGLRSQLVLAEDAEQVQQALQQPSNKRLDAWYVAPSLLTTRWSKEIVQNLTSLGRPAIHGYQRDMLNGALMCLSLDTDFAQLALADLVQRVLAGEDAASIPVEQPRRVIFSVRANPESENLRVNPAVLRRADLVY